MSELRHVLVNQWSDVDGAPLLSGSEKDAVAVLFNETDHDSVAILPDFKLQEPDHDVVRASNDEVLDVEVEFGRLAVGYWEDYSDGAVRFTQFHRKNDPSVSGSNWGCYIPKSTTVVLEKGPAFDGLETPQQSLGAWSR